MVFVCEDLSWIVFKKKKALPLIENVNSSLNCIYLTSLLHCLICNCDSSVWKYLSVFVFNKFTLYSFEEYCLNTIMFCTTFLECNNKHLRYLDCYC